MEQFERRQSSPLVTLSHEVCTVIVHQLVRARLDSRTSRGHIL